MDMKNTPEVNAVAALAVAANAMQLAGEGAAPVAFLPEGYKVAELEDTLQAPIRKRGVMTLRDCASFIDAVKRQKTAATTLYHTVKPPRFLAVFNDHAETPGWADHRAVYDCPLSVEWAAWNGANKIQMNQETFAQFIEDNLPDIVKPAGADMLEISRTLQAKKKVNFASGIRLSNGENQLTYEYKVDGSAGAKGQLKIPETFTVGIPVFEGGPKYAVEARLRYRIADGGALTMWFDLERPHKIVEHAVGELLTEVETGTDLVSLNGSPVSSAA